MKGTIDVDGYLRYSLIDSDGHRAGITAYRLVAEAFIGPPPSPDHEVAHNNGSRVSCRDTDLRWALRVDNHADMQVHGTAGKGVLNGRAKITEQDVYDIRREYRRVKHDRIKGGVAALDVRYGLDRPTTISIATGKSWAHLPFEAEQDALVHTYSTAVGTPSPADADEE